MGDLSAHFSKSEFACHCGQCQMIDIDQQLIALLEKLITDFSTMPDRAIVKITSGYRCPAHNKAVGGAPNSQHCLGIAADIQVLLHGRRIAPEAIHRYLCRLYPDSHGIGLYRDWVHIDTRPTKARWKG